MHKPVLELHKFPLQLFERDMSRTPVIYIYMYSVVLGIKWIYYGGSTALDLA